MKIRFSKTALLAVGLLPCIAFASHWSYEGAESPEHWGEISSEFTTCQTGKNQSPINIDNTLHSSLTPLETHYLEAPATLLNNGHTLQASFKNSDVNSINIDGTSWTLQQFHFHAPSENTVHGKHYAMEMHLVHKQLDGDIAVVAVMFDVGAENPALAALWQQIPSGVDKSETLTRHVDLSGLLPADKHYWRFSGSLTTPPCSEGVTWLVLKQPLTLSTAQLEQFKSVMHHDNNRPVQSLHGRLVVE